MIKIVPNILSNSEADFAQQVKNLVDFELIDIDIAVHPFTNKSSLDLIKSLKILLKSKKTVSFHLMVQNPQQSINLIIESGIEFEQIFIHQESEIEFIKKLPKKVLKKLGITIKNETNLKGIDFYSQFSSIQLMTGIFGGQGVDFNLQSLEKSLTLRQLGYKGEIGIDGGVNLNTAKVIKDYPIDRVSVGSYIHTSKNPMLDKMKLELALNMKVVEESF